MCSTDDGWEWFSEKRVTARRSHTCDQCGLEIRPGDPYIKTAAKEPDYFACYHVHVGCDAVADFVRTQICEAHGENGWIPINGLDNEIENLRDYFPPEPTVDDIAACEALGIEVDWRDESDPTIGYEAVASWVWDMAKAPYHGAAS